MLDIGTYVMRSNEKLKSGVTDIFKIINIRPNNRYDIICTDLFGKTTHTGRIWKDIHESHFRLLTTGEMKNGNAN